MRAKPYIYREARGDWRVVVGYVTVVGFDSHGTAVAWLASPVGQCAVLGHEVGFDAHGGYCRDCRTQRDVERWFWCELT